MQPRSRSERRKFHDVFQEPCHIASKRESSTQSIDSPSTCVEVGAFRGIDIVLGNDVVLEVVRDTDVVTDGEVIEEAVAERESLRESVAGIRKATLDESDIAVNSREVARPINLGRSKRNLRTVEA